MASPVERGWLETELSDERAAGETYRDIIAHGRPALIDTYRRCFARDRLDAPVLPTTKLPARPVGHDHTVALCSRQVPTLQPYLHNTDPSSVAGLPCISVPAGLTTSGLPVGLSFDGPPGSDATILALAHAFELQRAELPAAPRARSAPAPKLNRRPRLQPG